LINKNIIYEMATARLITESLAQVLSAAYYTGQAPILGTPNDAITRGKIRARSGGSSIGVQPVAPGVGNALSKVNGI
jgi:hypothetical protein